MRSTILVFIGVILSSCGNWSSRKTVEWTMPVVSEKVPVEIEVVFEDIENKTYCLGWSHKLDSVNQSEGVFELQCYIRDSRGTIAQYKGSSTAFTHLYFTTSDSIISVYFKRGVRLDRGDKLIAISIDDYEPIYYKPVLVKVDRYKKQDFILVPDPDIVYLAYRNEKALNPDPMPRIGREFSHLWALDNHYLNKEDGKIKTGQKWLKKLGTYNCAHGDFGVIDPLSNYTNIDGDSMLGEVLIDEKKINSEAFDFEQFKSFENSDPY